MISCEASGSGNEASADSLGPRGKISWAVPDEPSYDGDPQRPPSFVTHQCHYGTARSGRSRNRSRNR